MKKLIIIALGIVLPTVLFGQLDRSIRPEAAPAPAINIEDSEVFTTENGITVILSENHKIPRVSFNLVMGATPQAEGNLAGLSQIAGSLIMSGTDNRSKDELDNEIDYIGASLFADDNSIFLSSLTKHMDKGLTLMSDILMHANFPQSEVDRIIELNRSSLLTAKSDAGTMAGNARAIANFPGTHPYGEVMTEETLDNINRDAIVAYYKQTFTPDQSYLVVVGDINKEEVTATVDRYFASWSGGKAMKQALPNANPNANNRVIFVKKPGAVQSVISITYPMDITPGHEDYLKLRVLNSIMGGGVFGNRLMQNLREDKAYTYGCRSRISVNEEGSWMSAGGNFRNEVTDSAIVEILFELDRITKELVEDDELGLTKSSMAGAFARSLEQPSTVARFALNIIKNDLPKDYYQTYLQRLAAITKEDILDVAKKYFTGSQCNIIVVGNEEVLDRLMPFDSDGKIEQLDAFGNPVVERLPADISADQLIENYVYAVSMTTSMKKANKKLKKVKSFREEIEMSMAQMPSPMKMEKVWMSPNSSGTKMEMQGMTLSQTYFNGSEGLSKSMQGGTAEYSAEEVASENKSTGLFPELNYASSGMEYELLGIEERDGKMCYVLRYNDGKSESFDYFDKENFMKVTTVSITTDGEETQESTINYSDYQEFDGLLFPMKMEMMFGPMTLSGKVTSREINPKVDLESFK